MDNYTLIFTFEMTLTICAAFLFITIFYAIFAYPAIIEKDVLKEKAKKWEKYKGKHGHIDYVEWLIEFDTKEDK